MKLWNLQKWKAIYKDSHVRTGLRVRYAVGVEPEVRESIMRFISFLRTQYTFPQRVVIYVKSESSIIARDGEKVNGTFLGPFDPFDEPYIKVATGDFALDKYERGRDNALATILTTVAHELSHYFQWVNGLEQTVRGEEYQATLYANKIIADYACYVEHP